LLYGDVEQIDYGREQATQLFRPQQLMLAGSPTRADDDTQTTINKPDAVSADHSLVDRYAVRGIRPADDSGIEQSTSPVLSSHSTTLS